MKKPRSGVPYAAALLQQPRPQRGRKRSAHGQQCTLRRGLQRWACRHTDCKPDSALHRCVLWYARPRLSRQRHHAVLRIISPVLRRIRQQAHNGFNGRVIKSIRQRKQQPTVLLPSPIDKRCVQHVWKRQPRFAAAALCRISRAVSHIAACRRRAGTQTNLLWQKAAAVLVQAGAKRFSYCFYKSNFHFFSLAPKPKDVNARLWKK